MTNYRRSHKGTLYFFTVVTCRRRNILTGAHARRCLRESWQTVAREHPFEMIALCLLPNHLHCIWRLPDEDRDYSRRWSRIKRGFSQRWLAGGGTELEQSESRKKKRELGIWQRRFWEHHILDADDQANHLHYIHYNPVKHGYAQSPLAWPWSTIHNYHRRGLYHDINWDVIDKLDLPGNIEYQQEDNNPQPGQWGE